MTKILLVEDDKSLREIYGVRLLAEGYDIVSAGDGEEALAMAIKERPQLIVSDVMMPKISGFDMLDILRSTTETRDIKVIMMTALSSDDQRQRGEQLGADRYLVKSQVGIEDVVRTVHEVLGDAPASNHQSQPSARPADYGRPTSPQSAYARSAAPNLAQSARPQSAPAPTSYQPQPTQPPAPQQPPQPQPQPTHQASAPHQAAPTSPAPQPPADLPRPTAPFSSDRPASLGERIIHPLETNQTSAQDFNDLISQELSLSPSEASFSSSQPTVIDGQSDDEIAEQIRQATAQAQPQTPPEQPPANYQPPAQPQSQSPAQPQPQAQNQAYSQPQYQPQPTQQPQYNPDQYQ